jgi:hypothetical protein
MNLTRYLTEEELPRQYTDKRWVYSLGNEFSDMKSATIMINKVAMLHSVPIDTISVTVYPLHHGMALCCYTVPQPFQGY